jgi:hypothetical protein
VEITPLLNKYIKTTERINIVPWVTADVQGEGFIDCASIATDVTAPHIISTRSARRRPTTSLTVVLTSFLSAYSMRCHESSLL